MELHKFKIVALRTISKLGSLQTVPCERCTVLKVRGVPKFTYRASTLLRLRSSRSAAVAAQRGVLGRQPHTRCSTAAARCGCGWMTGPQRWRRSNPTLGAQPSETLKGLLILTRTGLGVGLQVLCDCMAGDHTLCVCEAVTGDTAVLLTLHACAFHLSYEKWGRREG